MWNEITFSCCHLPIWNWSRATSVSAPSLSFGSEPIVWWLVWEMMHSPTEGQYFISEIKYRILTASQVKASIIVFHVSLGASVLSGHPIISVRAWLGTCFRQKWLTFIDWLGDNPLPSASCVVVEIEVRLALFFLYASTYVLPKFINASSVTRAF